MKELINREWEYRSEVTGNQWKNVTIPHTPKIEEFNVGLPFQGLSYYKKKIDYKKEYEGKLLYVEFEAVMMVATVFFNGEEICSHKGGYLPFRVDITNLIKEDGENILEVIADNRDHKNVPPGKPAELLDFCYWGGIYRNVWLCVEDKLHITNEIEKDIVKGGGVYVSYTDVSEEYATVLVKVNIENLYDETKTCEIGVKIKDKEGKIAAENQYSVIIESGTLSDAEFKFAMETPNLWSIDEPYLYTLEVELKCGEKVCDIRNIRIGIRSVSANIHDGFMLNGKKIKLVGVNRHQTYPHIGNAVHDNAQWRDAYKLKKGGFNFIRLSHYPQSQAFLDACDELGILVMEPTPGWQWCTIDDEFRNLVVQNIKDMIRLDRNHPSIVIWETSLNETGDTAETMWRGGWAGNTDEFVRFCRMEAEKEYDKGNFLTAGDSTGRHDAKSIGYEIVFPGPEPIIGKPSLTREYGDFEFGGNFSLTRRSRGDGELNMLMQAWNFIWKCNEAYINNYSSIGSAAWVGIDYNRGCRKETPICRCGIMDNYRLPKFAYHFFESQQDSEPVIYIANYWCDNEIKKVVVFSNCDEVALLINGKEIKRQRPDSGITTEYKLDHATADPFYWAKALDLEDAQEKREGKNNLKELYNKNDFFDGGNCESLSHPPFTFFDIEFEEGTLEAVGYISGKEEIRTSRMTPKLPTQIKLYADESGKKLSKDGDFLFVYASILDENGTVIPFDSSKISFFVEGDAEIIENSERNAEAGIATTMIKSGNTSGKIKVSAQSEYGFTDEIIIDVE